MSTSKTSATSASTSIETKKSVKQMRNDQVGHERLFSIYRMYSPSVDEQVYSDDID